MSGGTGRGDARGRERCRPSLLDQRAARQPQEDVLQRRASNEDSLRCEAALVGGDGDGLTVVGIEEDAVGEPFDAIGETIELAVEALLDARREAKLGDLLRRVAVDE